MHLLVTQITKEGIFYYAKAPRTKWIAENLGMVTLVGSQIWWTWETEDVFRRVRDGSKHAMKDFAAKLTSQLGELTSMVRSDLSNEVRKKVNTLIIIDVHARDIIDTYVRDSIVDAREFAWESQLRFYWDRQQDDILVRQCTGAPLCRRWTALCAASGKLCSGISAYALQASSSTVTSTWASTAAS